jgi:murein DD-endopeptidase MepM/ murein hydrolase activator NlpD
MATGPMPQPLQKTASVSRRQRIQLPHGVRPRVIFAGLALLGLVSGAFGVAQRAPVVESVDVAPVIEAVALNPVVADVPASTANIFIREERVQRGDTVFSLLARLQVSDSEAQRFFSRPAVGKVFVPWIPGRPVVGKVDADGRLLELEIQNDENSIRVVRTEDQGFQIAEVALPVERRIVMKAGSISSSLFAATDEAGIPDAIASSFAEVFSSEVDLHRDLRAGDRFAMVYEMLYVNGAPSKPGRLLVAEFVNQGRKLQALHFKDESGRESYFSPNGRSLRQAFLRSPLEFSRVTSGFSTARLHPVLQIWRAHKGIDYGAPTGTRVRVTAEGTVVHAGWQNGYGNTVVVQHGQGYRTLYGHLSAINRGVRPGSKLDQGDVIGFVGMTGLASGPHLHYEFHVNGNHVDPTRFLANRVAIELAPQARTQFMRVAADRMRQLSVLDGLSVASID